MQGKIQQIPGCYLAYSRITTEANTAKQWSSYSQLLRLSQSVNDFYNLSSFQNTVKDVYAWEPPSGGNKYIFQIYLIRTNQKTN